MLGHQGFWYDESYTAFLVHFSPGKMLGLIPSQESTPPLYYCVAWVWSRIFGDGPAGLRSLSAVCGTLTIPVVFIGARQLLANHRAALIVTALVACNPLLVWYSQEARAYSMLVLLCACSLAAFGYALELPRPKWLTLWASCSMLALATHYFAGLIVVPEALWLVYQHRNRRGVWIACGAVAAVGLALLPVLTAQSATGNSSWIASIPFSRRLGQVIPMALIGPSAPFRDVLKYVAYAAALVGVGLLAFRSKSRDRQAAALTGGLALAGLAISVLVCVFDDTVLVRNLLPLLVPAAMALACGFGVDRARLFGALGAVALCLVGIVAVIGVDADASLQRPNWQPVAAALGPPPRNGARILLIQRNLGLLPIGLYMPGLKYDAGAALQSTPVSEIDVISEHSPSSAGDCWWGAACNLVGSDLQERYALAGFTIAGPPRKIGQFEVLRMVSNTPQVVSPSELEHALTETQLDHDAYLIQR